MTLLECSLYVVWYTMIFYHKPLPSLSISACTSRSVWPTALWTESYCVKNVPWAKMTNQPTLGLAVFSVNVFLKILLHKSIPIACYSQNKYPLCCNIKTLVLSSTALEVPLVITTEIHTLVDEIWRLNCPAGNSDKYDIQLSQFCIHNFFLRVEAFK